MLDKPRTPPASLERAREIAHGKGLKYVYAGNVHDRAGGSTWCPSCGTLLIERDWFELGVYDLDGNRCRKCGSEIAGHFEKQPGTWGARRQPVRLG